MGKQSEGKEIEIFGAIIHVLLIVGMIISLTIHDNRIANAPVVSEEPVAAEETGVAKTVATAVGEKTGNAESSSNEAASGTETGTETTTSAESETSTESEASTESAVTEESTSNVAADTDGKSEDQSDNKAESTTVSKTETDTKAEEKTDGKTETNSTVAEQQDEKTEKKKDKSTSKGSSNKNTILQDIITGYVGFRIWDHVEYIDDNTVYHLKDTTEFDPGFYKDLYGDVLGEHGFVSYEDMLKHYEQYGREELRYTTKESYEIVTETEENTSDQSNDATEKKDTEVVTAVYEFVIESVSYDGKTCSDYSCNMNNGQPVRVAYEFTYKLDAKGEQQELLSAKLAEGEPAGFGLTLNFGTAGDAVTFSWVTFNSLTVGKTPDRSGTGSISGVTTSGKPVQVIFRYRIQ